MNVQERPATVLAIDDDPAVLDAFRLSLGAACTVLTAASGPAALDVLIEHSIDVVLLDLRLPGMDGLEVLKRIRARHAHVFVIVVTAVADPREIVRSVKLGAWDYLTKPWSDDELTGAVARACREARAAEGVLLVSEDRAAMAPLHLALERRYRVATTGTMAAVRSTFPARVVVMDAGVTGRARRALWATLHHRLPKAAWILLIDDVDESDPRRPALPVATTIAVRPYQVDDVLPRIDSLFGRCDRREDSVRPLPRPVAGAIDLMTRAYGQPLTIGDYARAVGLSYDRFAHVFREAIGMSVKEYLIRLRITVARRLLEETDQKLDEVARLTGFGDTSNFSRAFTSRAGIRPGHFRSALRRVD
jgi:CheY-like chemotaxis protein/AraC-like DNA-binding protein